MTYTVSGLGKGVLFTLGDFSSELSSSLYRCWANRSWCFSVAVNAAVPVITIHKLMSRISSQRPSPAGSLFTGHCAQPALLPSLFPNVPPTINFVLRGQKGSTCSCTGC